MPFKKIYLLIKTGSLYTNENILSLPTVTGFLVGTKICGIFPKLLNFDSSQLTNITHRVLACPAGLTTFQDSLGINWISQHVIHLVEGFLERHDWNKIHLNKNTHIDGQKGKIPARYVP